MGPRAWARQRSARPLPPPSSVQRPYHDFVVEGLWFWIRKSRVGGEKGNRVLG